MLQLAVNKLTVTEPLDLRLYTNNYTPVAGSTAANFTEASGSGYASIALTGSAWTISGGAPTTAAYAARTFTFTNNLGNIYGYYLTRHSTGDLIMAERFSDGPYNIQNSGDSITVTPNFSLN